MQTNCTEHFHLVAAALFTQLCSCIKSRSREKGTIITNSMKGRQQLASYDDTFNSVGFDFLLKRQLPKFGLIPTFYKPSLYIRPLTPARNACPFHVLNFQSSPHALTVLLVSTTDCVQIPTSRTMRFIEWKVQKR